jgi:hypothetical protein
MASKRIFISCLFIVLVIGIAWTISSCKKSSDTTSPSGTDVTGYWAGSYTMVPGGTYAVTMQLTQSGNSCTGTINSAGSSPGTFSGTVNGNTIEGFMIILSTQTEQITLNGTATVMGDSMTFDFTVTSNASAYTASGHGWAVRDVSAPTILSTVPAQNDTGVSIHSPISVYFSEAMDPATITGATFTVKDNGNNVVGGSVSSLGSSAAFIPLPSLQNGMTYTATITTGVKDMGGHSLAADYSWSFTASRSSASTGGFTGNFLAWTGSSDASHYFTLIRLNAQTGAVTTIGGDDFFTDMEYSPDGVLYGISDELCIINTANGSIASVGNFHTATRNYILMGGGAMSPNGTLYVIENGSDTVFTVNLTNGALTKVGYPTALIIDLEFVPNGTLFAGFASLFTLNPATMATLSTIGSCGTYIGSMASGAGGTLYGIDKYPSTHLYSLSQTTGHATALVAVQSNDLVALVAERSANPSGSVQFVRELEKHGRSIAKSRDVLLAREKYFKQSLREKLERNSGR